MEIQKSQTGQGNTKEQENRRTYTTGHEHLYKAMVIKTVLYCLRLKEENRIQK